MKKIILSLTFVGFIVLAQNNDFSFYDSSNNFLVAEKIVQDQEKQNPISDFIFPLAYDQENLKEVILKNSKPTWNYIVKKGETLWSISKKFKVPLSDLLVYNNLNENSLLKAGDKILIPGAKPQAVIGVQSIKKFAGKFVSALTEIGSFVVPVSGFNWGKKHAQNGSDIAAECGKPVYAANSGLVVESSDGWNSGYGNYIIIQHQGGVYTLYGHLSLRIVQEGDKVEKGELIGYVGNTGHTVGQTGCHLHFEVRGSSNPLLK